MRPLTSWCSSLLVALALAVPIHARAQACCAGSSTLTPARLGIHEDSAAGAIVRGTGILGSYAPGGRYYASPAGVAELGGEVDVVGTMRFLTDGQVTVLLPLVATWRQVAGLSELGAGVGDLNIAGRYDFWHAGRSTVLPGIAVMVGVTFPSGRAPEAAQKPLATDATGIGAFQLTGGVALEQSFGHFLVNLTVLASWRTLRQAQGVSEQLGVQLQGLVGVGYVFDNEMSVALALGETASLDAVVDGVRAPMTGRGLPTVSLSGSTPLGESWRLQGGLSYNPPVGSLGWNQTAGLGFTLSLLRTWS